VRASHEQEERLIERKALLQNKLEIEIEKITVGRETTRSWCDGTLTCPNL
jgi:hypothetical protein